GRRKLRLFACACCRREWNRIVDHRCRAALEVAERFADGLATEKERCEAEWTASVVDAQFWRLSEELEGAEFRQARRSSCAARAVGYSAAGRQSLFDSVGHAVSRIADIFGKYEEDATGAEKWLNDTAALVRDIFGNPFRPISLNPAWLTSTVTALGR